MIRLKPPPLAAALAGALALSACDRGERGNTYAPPPPPEVIVANPAQREVVSYLTYTGVVEASETVELRARVSGFLESINFKPGQRVKKGELLFVIDKRAYIAAVEQAAAAVASQEAALEGAENDSRLARQLAEQRAGPEIDAIIKTARRDSVKADLAMAQANLSQARLNLEYCDVVSPIDGRISKNLIDVGNLVGRDSPTLLATIVQATPAFVSVDVSEADVLRIRRERERTGIAKTVEPGQVAPGVWRTVELALNDDPTFPVKGRIDYVEPQVNIQTGTLRVRTRFDNAEEWLLPGLFAKLRFPMSTQQAMLVPDAALLSDQQGRFAMVVNEKDEVEPRRVKIGVLDGSDRVVEEGLKPEDRVIVLGLLKARPGSKVAPKKQDQPAPGR